jgi:WD40 repeat protein
MSTSDDPSAEIERWLADGTDPGAAYRRAREKFSGVVGLWKWVFLALVEERVENGEDPAAARAWGREQFPELATDIAAQAGFPESVLRAPDPAEDQPPADPPDLTLLHSLGQGGMGQVFLAWQESLKRYVAVKFRRRVGDLTAGPPEWEALARLNHDNIVPVYGAGRVGDWDYFVMRHIRGATLADVVYWIRGGTASTAGDSPLTEMVQICDPSSGVGRPPSATQATAPRPPAGPTPFVVPKAYQRSIAKLMADVADAVAHAHRYGFLHRDIKPSNVMKDTAGKVWVIDFGLAREMAAGADPAEVGGAGTWRYMAPEQLGGTPGVHSDVWGLGVTLYELLTLRPAFTGDGYAVLRDQIQKGDFVPPARVARGLHPDLDAIVTAALRKNPRCRYETAAEFAADLRRWLAGAPTRARPAGWVRGVSLRAARNPGWAAGITVLAVSLLIGVPYALVTQHRAAALARRDAKVQEAARVRLTDRLAGWSGRAWGLLEEAAAGNRDGLREPTFATLDGLDAIKEGEWPDTPASGLGFAPDGSGRLALGGATNFSGKTTSRGREWRPGTPAADGPGPGTPGPVAYRTDGRPVQFVADDSRTYRLVNLENGETVRTFTIPGEGSAVPATRLNAPALYLAPTASTAAASAEAAGGGVLAVWDAGTGRLLVSVPKRATAVAVTDDATLVAGGDADGNVFVWSLPDGRELARFELGRCEVHALAFGPNPRRRDGPAAGPPFMLAAGDAGGNVVVWDLHDRQPRTRCHGSLWEVYAVRFHPDGQTLITGGRDSVRFWDLATGRKLLFVPTAAFLTGLAVSPDGGRVAVASHGFDGQSFVALWRLEFGRGIREWRGLTAPVTQTALSTDGRYLAALAGNWQVGIWDRVAGRLVHVLDVPRGFTADNAAMRFDAAGARFAFVSGRGAKLWDVATGRVLGAWTLPPGLQDHLAFRGDRLFLARMEVRDGEPGPFTEVSPDTNPRVCPVRELVVPGEVLPLWVLDGYPRGCRITGPADGTVLVTDRSGQDRLLATWDLASGRPVWSRTPAPSGRDAYLATTVGDGHVAAVVLDVGANLFDLRSGEPRPIPGPPPEYTNFTPDLSLWTGVGGKGSVLGRTSDGARLLNPAADRPGGALRFARDGGHDLLLWGTLDGAALVADIPEVRRRLDAIGLGW